MIAATSDALAGHAGEAALQSPMPHEILGGIVMLTAIGVILIVIGAVGLWLLLKIERHLRKPQ